MATIRTRRKADGSVSYQAIVRRRGYPDQRRTFPSKQLANDWAYDLERDIRDRRVDPRALSERKTVADAIGLYLGKVREQHKSFKDTQARCGYFSDVLGGVRLSELSAVMIDEAVDKLDCSGATKNRYIGALGGCLEFVRKTPYQWIVTNPARDVTRHVESRPRARVFTPQEWSDILALADQQATRGARASQLPTYLRLAWSLGRRRGELLKLRWIDVDFDAGEVWLLDTKTGEDQVVPLRASDIAMLKAHQETHFRPGYQYVFSGRFPNRTTSFDTLIRAIIREVCTPDRRGEMPVFHSVRHTVLTELGDRGASEAQIRAVSGHASSASVNRYVKKTVAAARAAQALRDE